MDVYYVRSREIADNRRWSILKFGVSYFTYQYAGYDVFEQAAEILASLSKFGCQGVDVPGEPRRIDGTKLKELASSLDLEFVSIEGMWRDSIDDRDLTSSDGAKRKRAIKYAEECIDFMSEIDAKYLSVSACPIISSEQYSTEKLRRNFLRSIKPLAKYADDNGGAIILEPLNRFEGYPGVLNTLKDAVELIDEKGVESAGVHGDLFHMNIEETSIERALIYAGRRLTHLHVVDSNRQAPGMGHLNFISILRTLREIGYDGYLTIESYPPQLDPNVISEAGITYLKAAMAAADLQIPYSSRNRTRQ